MPERALQLAALLALLIPTVAAGQGADSRASCNPSVRLDAEDAALVQTLERLAREHDFTLTYPEGMERSITLHDTQPLDVLLEHLTAGLSTMFIHSEAGDCTGRRIVRLVIYPEGEQGDMIGLTGGRVRQATAGREYIYVEDMDSYVREVLENGRSPELVRLTPEQRVEFRMARKRLRQEMQGQGKDGTLRRAQRERRSAAIHADGVTGKATATGSPNAPGGN